MELIFGYNELPKIIEKIKPIIDQHSLVTFQGPLGAGKTTLIKELLRVYGVDEIITSPTFTYLNLYTTSSGTSICHFDLYRLTNPGQFFEMGFEEFLYHPGGKVFMEWPERLEDQLPTNRCEIKLDYHDADQRHLSIVSHNSYLKKG